MVIQSLCPDLYFFFGGFHLLFSAYMWAHPLRSSTPFSLLPPGSLVYPGARSILLMSQSPRPKAHIPSASALQYWFSWIDPDYPHVYRPSLGCRHPWHFDHCWLDDPRRRERDLFCPGKFALIELFHCSKEYDSLTIIRFQDIQPP